MLYGGKILYICYMVDCTGGAITWQMQCQAHAVKATMDDFFGENYKCKYNCKYSVQNLMQTKSPLTIFVWQFEW